MSVSVSGKKPWPDAGLRPLVAYARRDWSSLSLFASNLLTIVVALVQHWDVKFLMWIYWSQSVIIGVFNFIRMIKLERFSTEGVTMNDQPVDPTPSTRRHMAFFFLVHYGLFHAAYLAFLLAEARVGGTDVLPIAICVLAFFLNHAFSFRYNLEGDRRKVRNIGTIMFFPYARIIPMHLTIIFGFGLVKGTATLLIFLVLKTFADLIMHAVEHAALGEGGSTPDLEQEGREDREGPSAPRG